MNDRRTRRSGRLRDYDYARPGAYFVTVVTQHRRQWFARSRAGMELTDAGHLIRRCWTSLPDRFPEVALDQFVVMPDHLHAILHLGPGRTNRSLPDVLRVFKSESTVLYARAVYEHGWPSFPGRLWERGYHERVIRNERELLETRRYIVNNPAAWLLKQDVF